MEKLKIIQINNSEYSLKNVKGGSIYKLSMTFFDLKKELVVGDIICMHKELLDPSYVEWDTSYYFGPINEVYGRKVKGADDIDVIAIQTKQETIVLKRFFG